MGYYRFFFSVLILTLGAQQIEACTGIKLTAKDKSIVHGRTLEFGVKIDASVAVVPRNYSFQSTTEKGPGLSYKSKYAAVGAITYGTPLLLDGLNEKGLAVGTFYFPGFAGYTDTTSENQAKSLSPLEFPNWILTQFGTIDEVKSALGDVYIANLVSKEWGSNPPPFHYFVIDKSGKGLVIEPVNGKLITYDNPLGVLTNSPSFDWHMTNLRNFINLSPINVKPETVEGVLLTPFGQGSGLVGLPGDFTPTSRFVRAAIFSVTALPSKNSEEAIFLGFHILNQFDIPVGIVRDNDNGTIQSDYTQITCMRDPQTFKYYFKTYGDQTIRVVDLTKFDLNASTVKSLLVEGTQNAIDISSILK